MKKRTVFITLALMSFLQGNVYGKNIEETQKTWFPFRYVEEPGSPINYDNATIKLKLDATYSTSAVSLDANISNDNIITNELNVGTMDINLKATGKQDESYENGTYNISGLLLDGINGDVKTTIKDGLQINIIESVEPTASNYDTKGIYFSKEGPGSHNLSMGDNSVINIQTNNSRGIGMEIYHGSVTGENLEIHIEENNGHYGAIGVNILGYMEDYENGTWQEACAEMNINGKLKIDINANGEAYGVKYDFKDIGNSEKSSGKINDGYYIGVVSKYDKSTGVYSGDNEKHILTLGSGTIEVKGIMDDVYGIENYNGTVNIIGETKIIAESNAASAYGIYHKSEKDFTIYDDISITVSGNDDSAAVKVDGESGSVIFKNGLATNVNSNAKYALYAEDANIEVQKSDSDVQLNGDILVNGEGKVDVVFNTESSKFEGAAGSANIDTNDVRVADKGNIDLTFNNGSQWKMTGNSIVTNLEVNNKSVIDMTNDSIINSTLTAKTLSGDKGIIYMDIDASKNVNNSDRLYIDKHTGTHYIELNNIGSNIEGAQGTVLVSVGEEDGSFEANDQEGALFWKKYELEKVDSTQDGYTKDWVLAGIERIDDKSTTSVETILGTNAMNYHTWRAESDKLMRRMGELRHNGENEQGVWFRVRGSEISRDDDMAFKNKYTAYEFGYDTVTKQTADLTRYTGVALTYIDGEGSYNNGSGDNHSKALSIYNTDIRSSGHYLDLVFKVADMDNDYRVIDSNRNVITGEYQNTGVSLSAEYGRKNDFVNGWYIEPQVQMSVGYLGGDNYKTSNGISVEQGGMASVLGRAGFNIGKKIGADGVVYLKANMLHEFVGDYDIDMTDAKGNVRKESGSFDDTWFEYGIGASIKTGKNNYLYFDFEKTVGGDFKKDWAWNAGMRWNF